MVQAQCARFMHELPDSTQPRGHMQPGEHEAGAEGRGLAQVACTGQADQRMPGWPSSVQRR